MAGTKAVPEQNRARAAIGKDRRITNETRCSRQQPQGNQWPEDVGFPLGQMPLVEAEGPIKCGEFASRVPYGGKRPLKGKGKSANESQAWSRLNIDQDL
jgi:hypothetical protein